MVVSRRGLKRAKSEVVSLSRQQRFTNIVRSQDGLCWYCGGFMGGNCNREHLLARALGGKDWEPEGNSKATHVECNTAAGHLPVQDKLRLREVGMSEGQSAMILLAYQLRRADTRRGYDKGEKVSRQNRNYWRKFGLESKPTWWDG